MNTVKAALLHCLRVFFKTRNVVLGTGDLIDAKIEAFGTFLLSLLAAILLAVFVAFAFVFFGASKSVGAGAGVLILIYYFFNFFRYVPPPRDYRLRGRKVESKETPDDFP